MVLLEDPTKIFEKLTNQQKTDICDDAILDFHFFLFSISKFVFNNYVWILLFFIGSWMVYFIYRTYFVPICYIKKLADVGFDHITGKDRMVGIKKAIASKKIDDKIPPPFPNGWFAVAESRDLKIRDVLVVDALGKNLCVYRGEDGEARVMDAYCVHLGANMAVGGKVVGNCVRCPFHEWSFDRDGLCTSLPGDEKVPKGISINTWTCVEADGAVWIWHDSEQRDPQWELEDAPECKQWGYRGRNEFEISTHIQDIPENGADVAHLNVVHGPSMLSRFGNKYAFLEKLIGRHVWAATWASNGDHTTSISLTHDYRILGCDIFHTSLKINQIGPGHVRLRMNTPVGPFLLSQSVTPIGPLLQRVTNRLFSPVYNAFASSFIITGEAKMIERDIKVWNTKRYIASPMYTKADKNIRMFRIWFSQFYDENSISFKDAYRNNNLDW